MNSLNSLDYIRKNVLENNFEQALADLSQSGTVRSDAKLRNEILLQISKCRKLEANRRLGTQSAESLSLEENRIRLVVLELIDLIEANAQTQKPFSGPVDAFISYRRADGAEVARLIRAELIRHNCQAFLDVEDLGGGDWNESLLERIQEARNFIVILSQESLSRIRDENDVMEREISHAISLDKKVIPILMPEFQFPSTELLPVRINTLQQHNGVSYSHEFFQATIEKLMSYLD